MNRFEIYDKDADIVRDTETGNLYLLKICGGWDGKGTTEPSTILETLVRAHQEQEAVQDGSA